MFKSFYYTREIFKTSDQEKANKLLNELLDIISRSINKSSFKYRIFKSKIHRIEYAKSNSLKKDALFTEGVFKKDLKGDAKL